MQSRAGLNIERLVGSTRVRANCMSLAIEAFVENVRGYCGWVESNRHDLLPARQFLLALMQGIPYLTVEHESAASDGDFARRGYAGWECDFQRLNDFPFHLYRMIYSPCELNNEEPMGNDIRDDLADIYGDLWHGLQALDRGDGPFAVEYWRDSYFWHWGHHAAAAVRAIDEFYRQTEDGDPNASPNSG